MTAQLRLFLLGGLQIFLDDTPVTGLRTKKATALLCFLAVNGHSFSRPALAGLFWGETPESNALMNLRKALTELRRHLPDHLLTTRHSISINPEAPHWLDVQGFEAPVLEMRHNPEYSREEINQLETAAHLYKGDFLDGFFIRNTPAFEEWMLGERARLKDLALGALRKLAECYAGWGEYEVGIEITKRIFALEPWLEEAHQDLMRLYALNGQRSFALAQYEKCRKILGDELGVEPGVDTFALYEKIRNGEITPAVHRPVLASGEFPISTNLKPQPLAIVGREAELADLGSIITNPNARLVSIVGPGGIGKTRLAQEFAQNQLGEVLADRSDAEHRFPDGVYFVPLASLEAGELIAPAIAEAMRLRLDYGESQLFDYLKARRILLVLDNFEHLIEEGRLVSSILRSAPNVTIVVTSRERLRLQEEYVYPLKGLDYPDASSVGMDGDFSAGRLFVQVAQRQQPEFSLAVRDVELVARICQIVEGMPLALELAASWTAALPLADIHSEIQRSFDFLTAEYRNFPERHRSVRAVIDISWERLSPNEQKLFSGLSIFRGGFTREAAEAITGAAIRDLAALAGKSLLRYENSANRFYVHELLRQYGAEKLSQDKQAEEELRDHHSQYFLQWIQDQFDQSNIVVRGRKVAQEQMTIELENARAAWTWSLRDLDRSPTISALQMRRIGMYFISRGGYLEGDRAFRNIADRLAGIDASSEAGSMVLKASSLIWQAVFGAELGDRKVALQLLEESKALLDSPQLAGMNLPNERAHHLVNYTRADWTQPFDVRLARLDQAIQWYREAEEPFGLAFALTNRALMAIVTGRLEEAGKLLEESVVIQNQSRSQLGLAASYTELGILSFVKNDYEKAKEWLRKSVDVAQELENLHRITAGSIYLGTVHIYSGQFNRAREILKKCVSDSAELGIRPRHATALNYLGYAELHLGNYQAAEELGGTALDLARETGNVEMVAQAIMLFGAIALARENFAEALDRFQEALSEKAPQGFVEIVYGEDCGQVGLGAALLHLDRVEEASVCFSALWQRAGDNHRVDQASQALVGQALLKSIRGENHKARELYALAATQPFVGQSRWFADAFGRHIASEYSTTSARGIGNTPGSGTFQDLWAAAENIVASGKSRSTGPALS